ncbi:TIGR02444 family protein [Neptuniibacter caesariensis]|uniref:TIGR02444 family protein n=1 Tax=Neptuniibacter caesariensis TaxID=207954 RepID=A0A7U8C4Q7_NEPCE|nr:TIGR02444 family protein [Neptuniibacter caesariensis]EAR61184.1 hypothetical protein MED92_04999 [Oceanospirillum sp. MED92] [Neptuniibacter caesariensis]
MAADFTTPMKLKNDLWDFALLFYQHPGIESLCLKLQDQYGLSINRLIMACWAGLKGKELNEAVFESSAEQWKNQITQPLREVRYKVRQAKADTPELEACYAALRKAELACEQVELALLYEVVEGIPESEILEATVEKNLYQYLNFCKQPIDNLLEADIQTLVRAAKTYLGTNMR